MVNQRGCRVRSIGSLRNTIEVAKTLRDAPGESSSVAITETVVTFLVYAKHTLEPFEICDFKLVPCCAMRDVEAVWFGTR